MTVDAGFALRSIKKKKPGKSLCCSIEDFESIIQVSLMNVLNLNSIMNICIFYRLLFLFYPRQYRPLGGDFCLLEWNGSEKW